MPLPDSLVAGDNLVLGVKTVKSKVDVLHGFAACPSQVLVFGWVGSSLVLGWALFVAEFLCP